MRKLLLVMVALILSIMTVGCSGKNETPQKAATNAIEAIKNMDTATMENYFGTSAVLGEDVTEAMLSAIGANLSISTGATVNENGVMNVTADITNVDMAVALASVDLDSASSDEERAQMLSDAITANAATTVTNTVEVPCTKTETGWTIELTPELVTAISGGYM